MRVSIIGQGYVGLTVAIGAANAGHNVIGFDINKSLVNELISGKTHVPGINIKDLLSLQKSGHYSPTSDLEELGLSEIIVLAVPTPLNNERKPDLKFLESASTLVAQNIANDALIIN
jgi:UDP-N-acetyl-D-glucosamine dehydrogenase